MRATRVCSAVAALALGITAPLAGQTSWAQGVIGTVQGTIEGDPSLTPGVNGGLAPGSLGDRDSGVAIAPLDPLENATAAPLIESLPGVRVVLRGLDKMTGDVETLDASVGEEIRFHRLRIAVEACYARLGGGSADASAFLKIIDEKTEAAEAERAASATDVAFEPAPPAFSGWMFAASPALSAMDHPRYDVWVLSCAIS